MIQVKLRAVGSTRTACYVVRKLNARLTHLHLLGEAMIWGAALAINQQPSLDNMHSIGLNGVNAS